MGRLSRVLGLSVLLLTVGQLASAQQANTVTGAPTIGSQTPLPAAVPLASPPAIALPGSGTPIGAPVQVGVNDPRNGSGYVQQTIPAAATPESYIVNTPMVRAGTNGNTAAVNVSGQYSVADTGKTGWRPGTGTVIGATSARTISSMSVADAAAQFKARKGSLQSRRITNQDIYALKGNNPSGAGFDANAGSMPQSDVGPEPNNATSQGVLDQRDLDLVNAALARSRAKQSAKEKSQVNPPAQQDSGQRQENPKQ